MAYKQVAIAATAAFAVTGCASIITGTTQSIAITTPPTTRAECTLTSPRGTWTVTTPNTIALEKSKNDIQVLCTKPGFEDAAAVIPADFQGWTIGNVLIGGLIGLGVDAATGAIHEYPNAFQVQMKALPGAEVVAMVPPRMSTAPMATPVSAVRPSLGIIGSTVTRGSSGPAVFLSDPYGAFVSGVAPRSAAAEAGIEQGDIIRSFNGRRVATFEELDRFAAESAPGSRVILGVYRNRQIVDVEVGF
jgi:hypothetical protein